MTRSYRFVIAALALCLMLSACADAPAPETTDPGYPTLPSFPQQQSPAQQLSAAVDKTKAEKSYGIQYGIHRQIGAETSEDSHSQAVTPEQPLDWNALYGQLPQLPEDSGFLERFCQRPLRAIPSNTGVIRYVVADLTGEDAQVLLYGKSSQTIEKANWTVALEVDAAGRLIGFEMISEGEEEIQTVFLRISFPENP